MAIELPVLLEGIWQGQTRPGGEFPVREVDEATGEVTEEMKPYGPTFAMTYFDADGNFKVVEFKSSAVDAIAELDVAGIKVGSQVRVRGQAMFFESKKNRGQGFFKFEVQAIEQL